MKRIFIPLVKELKNREIEWSPKHKVKINLFEEELNPGIRINTFASTELYREHLMSIYQKIKRDIELEIRQYECLLERIKFLEELRILLTENRKAYFNDNQQIILYTFKFKTPNYFKDINEKSIRNKILVFIEFQKEIIATIDELIKLKIKIYKYKLNIEKRTKTILPENNLEFPLKFNNEPLDLSLIWLGKDIDLLEIIVALYESQIITSSDGKLTLTQSIQITEKIFNKKLKDPYVKLNQAKARKKGEQLFINELSELLRKYYQKKQTDN